MKEGASDFQVPKKSVIRYDFPARGNMPAVKLFWYDGLKATPKIDGVAELGELLERFADARPRPCGQGQASTQAPGAGRPAASASRSRDLWGRRLRLGELSKRDRSRSPSVRSQMAACSSATKAS